ncbi:tetratricopeptide repeat protein [Nafulsella turpanensis]|uniref:tetratricopeptide repeat protein n=1 Tax=Nafulsella turpanensis TaxID=1265690 RepID=UPI00036FCD3E|nr:tetratricopeptide repeat protein [Nafulsella turpanensis]
MCISEKISSFRFFFALCAMLIWLVPASYAQDQEDIRLANQYFEQGETEKALSMYETLVKNSENVPFIHDNYLELLISTQAYKDAENYLERQVKSHANPEMYQIDLARLYELQGETKKANKLYEEIISAAISNNYKTNLVAQLFFNKRLYDRTLQTYQRAREVQKDETGAYALQMANIYRAMGEKEKMISEYFRYIEQNPRNMEYVKNMLQASLSEPEDLEAFKRILFEKVQKNPDNLHFSDLLIWVNVQQKNFYGAFVQARAMQKRLQTGASELIDLGIIALDNQAYPEAIQIFEYIADEFRQGNAYYVARRYVIKAREELVKNTYPVDRQEIVKLVKDYEQLVKEIGINNTSLEALNSKAMLHAFYLDQKDSAISILKTIIAAPRVDENLRAQSKLALGDIYLLAGEPWEATLLYSQVEKEHKDEPLGYEAKLKNAKLSYYKGEFALAQGHLDVLKEATTREIANDAMALSLLIKTNSALDTSDRAMKQYADAELLLFQNKKEAALQSLDSLLSEFRGHSLTDEVLNLQAKIALELGNYSLAVDKLTQITQNWGQDVLGDDAFYQRARIYEEYLDNKQQAMEYYREFLSLYPGSVYVSDARKRFRTLRGDFPN